MACAFFFYWARFAGTRFSLLLPAVNRPQKNISMPLYRSFLQAHDLVRHNTVSCPYTCTEIANGNYYERLQQDIYVVMSGKLDTKHFIIHDVTVSSGYEYTIIDY